MDPQLQQLVDALLSLGGEVKGMGWTVAGVAAGLVGAIRLWQKPLAQNLAQDLAARFPAARFLVWDELPLWAKFLVPFVGALVAGAAGALTGAVSWPAAIVGALVAGVTAILGHHGTKAAGTAIAPLTSRLSPTARAALSIVVPGPKAPTRVVLAEEAAPRASEGHGGL